MARPVPIAVPEETEVPKSAAPVYFLIVPGPTYEAISKAAAKRNITLAQLVSNAFSEYLKKNEGE